MAAIKSYRQHQEVKFFNKVKAFHEGAGDFSEEELRRFEAQLEKEGKKEKFVNELIEVIERSESEEKAKIIGGVFRRLTKSEVSYGQFEDQVRYTSVLVLRDIHVFMHGYHNHYVLEDGLGDVLFANRMSKRSIEIATKTTNMLAGETVQYIKTNYELNGIGKLYLETLHQVYKDKIDPRHLFVL
ncbi:hypothetical protein CJF39_08395 [Pseudomonas lundensis]|uniref:Uncharacterized protein n=1 Tax=Pseudomonas lundensis TaxID=86185 RepID=A0A266NDH8_9PSED|nr:hypothetical protein CJF39_08395 [Pseudomonas lundensis]